jgi:hypothetical protein
MARVKLRTILIVLTTRQVVLASIQHILDSAQTTHTKHHLQVEQLSLEEKSRGICQNAVYLWYLNI